MKKYADVLFLKYCNDYSNINQNNIKKINFIKVEIKGENIFKKYNEISFKVKRKGDSFIVINHSYYKY